MSKLLLILLFALFISLLPSFVVPVAAFDMAEQYTLPYPPQMPGSIFYKLRVIEEKVGEIWNFGSLTAFHYHLSLSDRYLVQAKTLIEYKQYLLAQKALQTSDNYFQMTSPDLTKAISEKKNVQEEKKLLQTAARKQIDLITFLQNEAPATFTWQPENAEATNISFIKLLNESITIRRKVL